MDIIVDTDILSTFAKIRKYDLLLMLFRHSKLFIAPRVYQDIITAKELGYDFIEHLLLQMPQICPLNQNEIEESNLLKQKEKTLGWGEIESIVLAKTRGFLLLSNDKKALKIASGLKIDYFNLPMILRQLWKQSVLSKESVLQTITEIETKDRIIVLKKERIFKP